MEESMTRGRSVSSWISVTARVIRAASSASGAPMFTSSSMAPPATCSLTSISSLDRSPFVSCSSKIFPPAGLLQRIDVRIEHRHGRGQERGEPDDVRLVLLDRLDEFLRRDLHA